MDWILPVICFVVGLIVGAGLTGMFMKTPEEEEDERERAERERLQKEFNKLERGFDD